MNALEDKHQAELEDLLKKLYDQRAKELIDSLEAFLEEKVKGQATIGEIYKAKEDALDAFDQEMAGDDLQKQLRNKRQAFLEADRQKELSELEISIAQKRGAAENELQRRALKREADQVEGLKQAQLEERKDLFERRMGDYAIKSFIDEIEQ
mmetsp:Transcript_3720/g.5614  ORF Transcript_3720/g.5614 Transcript_3720/m.5614 type:complete len:152 (+) Transcript_3720:7282-7737(+)